MGILKDIISAVTHMPGSIPSLVRDIKSYTDDEAAKKFDAEFLELAKKRFDAEHPEAPKKQKDGDL